MRAVLYTFLLGACSFSPGRPPGATRDDASTDDADDATVTVDGDPMIDSPVAIDAAVDARPDAMPDARTCGTDYVTIAGGQTGSRYKRYGFADSTANAMTFAAAQQVCAAGNGFVAIPDSAGELAMLEAVSQNGGTPGYWVGITDITTEGTWRTELGAAATYLPWKPAPNAQPNGGTGSNCVVGSGNELWDVDCVLLYPFTCECNL